MIRKKLFSIACALIVWVIGVSFYLLSYYIPILENPERQSNIILALAIIPSACFGTYLFYKKEQMNPSYLALTFIIVAVSMDALITVPLFIIPSGGDHASFFGDPFFYILVVEFYFTVLYYGNYLTKKIKT